MCPQLQQPAVYQSTTHHPQGECPAICSNLCVSGTMADVTCEEDYFFHWRHKEITTGLPKQLEIEPSTTAPYVARENLAQRCA